MKRTSLLSLIGLFALGYSVIFTGCGGGSSSGGKTSSNKYLGKMPSIYANYQAEKEAHTKKLQEQVMELAAGGEKNLDKLQKLSEESEAKLKALDIQFKADLTAEVKALVDKKIEIPVTYSENLKNSGELFYTVATPVILVTSELSDKSPGMALKFTALADTKLGDVAHIRVVASDGSTLAEGSVMFPKGKQVTAGETILEVNNNLISSIVYYPAEWENFAGIEFCTSDELSAANKERRERHKNQ